LRSSALKQDNKCVWSLGHTSIRIKRMFSKLAEKTTSIFKIILKEKDKINEKLPPEIMRQIFLLLPPRDLKNVLLVCKKWKEAGEDPYLWSWAMVTVKNDSLKE